MSTQPASSQAHRSRGMHHLSRLALAGTLLTACTGTRVTRTITGQAEIKTPPMSQVTVSVTPDNTVTVETRPVPLWEAAISGLVGGFVKGIKHPRTDP